MLVTVNTYLPVHMFVIIEWVLFLSIVAAPVKGPRVYGEGLPSTTVTFKEPISQVGVISSL